MIFFFSKLVIFIIVLLNLCSLKDSQNFFMQPSPLYTSCLFYIPSNVHNVDSEYLQVICLPTFVLDNFSELHQSIFFNQRIKICLNSRWCLIRFPVLIELGYISFFRSICSTPIIFLFIYFLCDSSLFVVLKKWRQFKR